jgi:hypothetical protein
MNQKNWGLSAEQLCEAMVPANRYNLFWLSTKADKKGFPLLSGSQSATGINLKQLAFAFNLYI